MEVELLNKITQGTKESEHSKLHSSVVNVHTVILMWYKYTRDGKRKKRKQNGGGKGGKMLKNFLS